MLFNWVHDSLHSDDHVIFFFKDNQFMKNGHHGLLPSKIMKT